ncbi:hypothetical protein GobsT_54330 [Gemmata obscuriglobus]|uniref:DUF2924 domain-containing protein n=1 Tax=Gemmata obscuriglobus TaxID=114 RepID=A0A2Z3GSI6_9BACT|nr:DUF2924 domain-containing protein [Gemmata obscuriglobus]AWM36723.1 DUF2924 domain-containing protein [Gemmata obscuriglobus]QEG30627.1 hypothetical protein GobsT_54330 [Gemmata obscuriglobus]VTS09954.1 Putative bacteriophage related protein OS=Isosphaera pallida (strain ATCC 43644 / DSM 9630 / IS1B) GN=Isop_2454 PE=4 SV=1: DUF2924 [Gemmata obscuriglobus UQM 2246]
MPIDVAKELAGLRRLTPKELRARYAEVFGEPTASGNRTWLVRRIAWRLQALAEGGLSARAQARAAELARDADLRVIPPKGHADEPAPGPVRTGTVPTHASDPRPPPPGTILTRTYKGTDVQVKVLAAGFAYDGRTFGSLSAVAAAVTGSHLKGFHFFKLNKPEGT